VLFVKLTQQQRQLYRNVAGAVNSMSLQVLHTPACCRHLRTLACCSTNLKAVMCRKLARNDQAAVAWASN
jgi:hypothetical protein